MCRSSVLAGLMDNSVVIKWVVVHVVLLCWINGETRQGEINEMYVTPNTNIHIAFLYVSDNFEHFLKRKTIFVL